MKFEDQIRAAQADSVLAVLTVSLLANSFIALTTAAVLWLQQPATDQAIWLVGIVTLNMLRQVAAAILKRKDVGRRDPKAVLNHLTIGAFASGCLWAFAPFLGPGLSSDGAQAYVIFIIAGISAGAIIQSTAYSRTAIAFGAPAMLAAVASLLQSPSTVNTVIAADVLLLMVMMFRSSRMSEVNFIISLTDRLKAVSLAASLSRANEEISSSNRQLEILASRDPLTGLGNRAAFNLRLDQLLGQPEGDVPMALLIIDLDRFKSINDTMGHTAGDIVLAEFARRLSAIAAPEHLVARLGGDEFAVVIEGEDAAAKALALGTEILDLTARPVMIGDRQVTIGSSVGLAHVPEHARSAEAIFACADIALYAAKEQGRRRLRVFSPDIKQRLDRQKQIEIGLEDALASGEVEVFFQPQVELSGETVIGFEALVRWNHPALGAISPPEIVQAARALHVSERLTRHVATAAADLVLRLPALGLAGICVAINVSPREFSLYSLSKTLGEVARAAGISPSQMEIEITEEATLDTAAAGTELELLEKAGFRLAVDDFGMGHSSLAYIISLKVDRLKIDRSFVHGIAASRQNQALVAALVGMGHALSIDIVIEGVETPEDAEVLRMLGCRFAQGYLYGRPMPAAALPAWLAARSPKAQPESLAGTA
ncbi:EAL domain-containing protein [Agrobacterium sp. a22-2]|uniref:putative bifunctional diguanylate cyclase/phosphodiesterase n=1 Tax=Agrobacterium sp. a22-2 TaxID=2283840 RepID=UPI001445BC8D|nr:EAL domain-containing protein [Agrobacterium sp. a22-2]NKN37619.1 EAL domain-containing protein [Agrobacterium sp. a22-2]